MVAAREPGSCGMIILKMLTTDAEKIGKEPYMRMHKNSNRKYPVPRTLKHQNRYYVYSYTSKVSVYQANVEHTLPTHSNLGQPLQ